MTFPPARSVISIASNTEKWLNDHAWQPMKYPFVLYSSGILFSARTDDNAAALMSIPVNNVRIVLVITCSFLRISYGLCDSNGCIVRVLAQRHYLECRAEPRR